MAIQLYHKYKDDSYIRKRRHHQTLAAGFSSEHSCPIIIIMQSIMSRVAQATPQQSAEAPLRGSSAHDLRHQCLLVEVFGPESGGQPDLRLDC